MIKIVFSDFDGTLTFNEVLSPIFFDILEFLDSRHIPFVIITGRSLSWAHFLLTHFESLKDVIAEGGGVWVKKDGKRLIERNLISESEIERLAEFCKILKKEMPELSLSVDSFGRRTDRAIELYDLQDDTRKNKVVELLKKHHINFSTSNVHLNFWCGDISKANAAEIFLAEKKLNKDEAIFFGDSLNDQSMFHAFDQSVGVSNIQSVLSHLTYKPSVILEGNENAGPMGVMNYLKRTIK